jgi:hypothetical protein
LKCIIVSVNFKSRLVIWWLKEISDNIGYVSTFSDTQQEYVRRFCRASRLIAEGSRFWGPVNRAVPQEQVAPFPPWGLGVAARSGVVGFVVEIVALGQFS